MGKKSINVKDKNSKLDALAKLDVAMDELKQESTKINQNIVLDSIPVVAQPEPDGRIFGYVKIWFNHLSYGFVTLNQSDIWSKEKHDLEYFIGKNEIADESYHRNLQRGQRISFIPSRNNHGLLALDIQIEPNVPGFGLEEQLKEL
jgi:hypothetical protein